MKQRENPEGVAGIESFKAHMDATRPGWEGYVSGAQIENFRAGWAHGVSWKSTSHVAHYFKRYGFDQAMSACGLVVQVRWLFGQGNYPRCRRCAVTMRGKA